MPSMLEALREYRHLAARQREEGRLPAPLQSRLEELEVRLKATHGPEPDLGSGTDRRPGRDPGPSPMVHPRGRGDPQSASDEGTASRRSAELAIPFDGRAAGRKPTKLSPEAAMDPLRARLERMIPESNQRKAAIVGSAFLLLLLAWILSLGSGLSLDTLKSRVLPAALLIGLMGWGGLYPILLTWREYAARRSRAHLSEPDFEVRIPLFEPLVLVLQLLIGTGWVLTSGLAQEGVGSAVGALLAGMLHLCALGVVAAALGRPYAAQVARSRAYHQYIEGSSVSQSKNNPRRARRLLERALAIVVDPVRRADLEVRREKAVLAEAEQLRQKGLDARADALVERLLGARRPDAKPSQDPLGVPRGRFGDQRNGVAQGVRSGGSSADAPRSPPAILPFDRVQVVTEDAPAPTDPKLRLVNERAMAFARRELAREAVELLVGADLPVPSSLAREAADQYVAQGVLRSAFVLRERLGEGQSGEFYKAAAVEWARANPPSEDHLVYGERLLDALEVEGEERSAARVACQAALDPDSSEALRSAMLRRAFRCFSRLDLSPPPELLELSGDHARAARAFELVGRLDDARRCLRLQADQMLRSDARPDQLIPVLSKLFHLDPAITDDRLAPLVEHVLDTESTGPIAQRILSTWRSRHPADVRAALGLFRLWVTAKRVDPALTELERVAEFSSDQPASLVTHYRSLVKSFPEHRVAREGLVRILLRAGHIEDAAQEAGVLVAQGIHALPRNHTQSLQTLLSDLREAGHIDKTLSQAEGRVALELGDKIGAEAAFLRYAQIGGQDLEAVNSLRTLLQPRLTTSSGTPDYSVHARLARVLLAVGLDEEAAVHLHVLRDSPDDRDQAVALAARAQLAVPEPERALKTISQGLLGRRPVEVPSLCFELARVYEAMGDTERSGRVDRALEQVHPGFAADYRSRRAHWAGVDTAPVGIQLDDPEDTDVGVRSAERAVPASTPEMGSILESPPVRVPPGSSTGDSTGLSDAIKPRYRLVRLVGSGGMGEVHLAEDLVLEREVAIKVLRRTLATDLFIAKFRDEARIVAQLSHPGIVGVFDIGQRDDWSFIVMEYVRGPNLATLVSASVAPPRSQILQYIAMVADAMAYAHRKGVVHRDLKPANILVGVDGEVKVTDFGIARVLAHRPGDETAFSAAGLQVGTVNYMAPEQLLYDRADARTDIYLLGVTLYYCLSRRYPFSGESAQAQKTTEEAPRLSERSVRVSPELDMLVASALARDPGRRPASMDVFAKQLRSVPEADLGSADASAVPS